MSLLPNIYKMINYLLALIDFRSFWFWISLFLIIIVSTIGIILLKLITYQKKTNDFIIYSILLFIPLILENFVYFTCLKKQPIFDYGFMVSIFVPVILFYFFLIIFIINLFYIKKLLKGIYKSNLSYFILFFFILLIKISFALAHSSPCGFFLSFISFILIIIQIILRPIINHEKIE